MLPRNHFKAAKNRRRKIKMNQKEENIEGSKNCKNEQKMTRKI